jgi:hypothetical protein
MRTFGKSTGRKSAKNPNSFCGEQPKIQNSPLPRVANPFVFLSALGGSDFSLMRMRDRQEEFNVPN